MPNQPPSRTVTWGYVIVNLMLIFAVAFGVYRVATTAVALAGGPRRSIDVEAFIPRESVPVPRDSHFVGDPRIRVHVAHPTKAQFALSSGLDLGPIVLFAIGLWLLRGVAGSVRKGDPFVAENVRRLRGIGFLLVVGSFVLALFEMSLRHALYNRLPPHPFGDLATRGWDPPGSPFIAGLGVFILAEVFARGLRLREDVEATI